MRIAAGDDEPPRAGRGRDRHRQDADAAAARRAAVGAPGVPVFVADVKGDLSGHRRRRARPASAAEKRQAELGMPFAPRGFPTEFLALGGIGAGVPVRATVSDFGPQLLAKVLGANETQEQSLGLVFHYADEKGLPLLDLADLRALLTYLDSDEGKAELEGHRRAVAARRSACCCARSSGSRTGGGNEFFGEPQFDDRRPAARRRRTAAASISCLELPARAGQAEAVLDRADVAARRAVRGRCPRPATSTSPSSCSSSTRRTCCSTTRPTRSSTRSRRRCG